LNGASKSTCALPQAVAARHGAEDLAGAEVGEEVDAAEPRFAGTAVAVAAGHRAAGAGSRVLEDRVGEAAGGAARVEVPVRVVEGVSPLPAVPAVVLAAGAGGRLQVDLLPARLPDVGDPQVAAQAVEGEAPGVAQPVGPDLAAGAGDADERVARGNGVGEPRAAAVDVDAQDLAEQGVERLPVLLRVAAAAAVARGDVEEAVRPERDLAAVVVGERLVVGEEDLLRGGVGDIRVGRHPVAGDHRLELAADGAGVVDEEFAVAGVVGMEGEPEEAALAAAGDRGREVEERLGEHLRAVEDQDLAGLLDDEQPSRAVAGMGQGDRQHQPGGALDGGQRQALGGEGKGGRHGCEEGGGEGGEPSPSVDAHLAMILPPRRDGKTKRPRGGKPPRPSGIGRSVPEGGDQGAASDVVPSRRARISGTFCM
jgi:hypothetical protein